MASPPELRHRWTVGPGKLYRTKLLQCMQSANVNRPFAIATLDPLLADLPFREEVAPMRDFRGGGCNVAYCTSLPNTDFSFSLGITEFLNCDLSDCKFEDCAGDPQSFWGSKLRNTSFRGSKFHGTAFNECHASGACFDHARLKRCRFDNAILREASFQMANLRGVCFAGADLSNCDFRNAQLSNAVLNSSIVNEQTDFRGANLTNAFVAPRQNSRCQIVDPGLDFDAVLIDDTTKTGDDPRLEVMELVQAALRIVDTQAIRIKEALQSAAEALQHGTYDPNWRDQVRKQLTTDEQDDLDEILNEADRYL